MKTELVVEQCAAWTEGEHFPPGIGRETLDAG